MPSHTPILRRIAGATMAAAVSIGGLAIATAPAAHAEATGSCTASFDKEVVRPGETATENWDTPGSLYYPARKTIDGQLDPNGSWIRWGSPIGYDYDMWSYQANGGTSVGYRFYAPGTQDQVITDSTPWECGAEVIIGQAPVAQAIDFPELTDHPLADGQITVAATADSGLDVDFSSTTTSVCDVVRPTPPPPPAAVNDGGAAQGAPAATTATVELKTSGYCRIAADQEGDSAHAAAPTAYRDFYVQIPQDVTFDKIPDTLLSAGSIELDATTPSGDYVGYTVADSSVCDLPPVAGAVNSDLAGRAVAATSRQTTTLTLKKVGTCEVTAYQPGPVYLPEGSVTRSFQVYENAVVPAYTLGLTVPAGVALSKHTAPFSATSTVQQQHYARQSTGSETTTSTTAKLAVTSATPAVCTVASATTVALHKAGTCTLTASQTGATSVTKSFPVWGAPALPAKGKTTQTVPVLGQGEADLKVTAKPATVCRVNDGAVTLVAPGTCKVTVTDGKTKVRAGKVKVAFVKSAKPSQQLKHGGTVRFAFNSAALTAAAKKTLRSDLSTLRKAHTVIVYGNTFGPGKNSAHSRKLAADRAAAVVGYLKAHGVKAKAVTVAAAMQNPVSKDPAKNRRADIYYLR